MADERSKTRRVEAEIEIDAPIEDVWKALTDAAELTRWFPLEARVEPGRGGTIWISWGTDYHGTSRIEIWEPPRRLRTASHVPAEWREAERSMGRREEDRDYTGRTTEIAVDYELESRSGKTLLRLVHSGFGTTSDWDDEYDGVKRGWAYELRALKHYLENHRGEDRAVAWIRALMDTPAAEVWPQLTGPGGFFSEEPGELVSGRRYRLRTPSGDRFEGVVLLNDPSIDFWGTVENLGDGMLRINVFRFQGRTDVHLWLGTYGASRESIAAVQGRWRELLGRLFPGAEIR